MGTLGRLIRVAAAAAVALAPAVTCGFSTAGHQLVALIAEHDLTTATRQAILQILPDQTLAQVSTWADAYRSQAPSTGPWHYIDYNIVTGQIEPAEVGQPNILDAISSNSQALRNSGSATTRQQALKFVVHFLGDLHQPLHCADNNDSGGNGVTVRYNGSQESLHSLWDGTVVNQMMSRYYPGKSVSEVADALYNRYSVRRDLFISQSTEQWARQSFEIARRHVYRLPAAAPGKPHVLDEMYMSRSAQIIFSQIAKAGLRLAHVLNTLLDPDYASSHGVRNAASQMGLLPTSPPQVSAAAGTH